MRAGKWDAYGQGADTILLSLGRRRHATAVAAMSKTELIDAVDDGEVGPFWGIDVRIAQGQVGW